MKKMIAVAAFIAVATTGWAEDMPLPRQTNTQEEYIEALKDKAECEERRAKAAIEELEETQEQVSRLEVKLREKPAFTARTDVFFPTNNAILSDDAKKHLKTLATQATENPALIIRIEGYADAIGPSDVNQNLSKARADAVKDFFLEQGLAETQLSVVGKGENEPLASNDTREGRALNRRTEVLIETAVGGAGPNR